MLSPKFQRRVEGFTCEFCGKQVEGSGYTNHCPRCLWSKHVDVNPGDRQEACGGGMEPVAVEGASPDYTLIHRCEKCGAKRRNKLQAGDNMETVMQIASRSH